MTLIVETGSGSSTAESYLSVADADAFHAKAGDPAAWASATTTEKEIALRQATQYIDDRYARQWRGHRVQQAQALRWPRYGDADDDGFALDGTSIPQKLKDAVATVALEILGGASPFVTETTPGDLTAKSITVGSISISKSFAGAQGSQPKFAQALSMLTSLITSGLVRERA